MAKMKNVIRIEMHRTVSETVLKDKRHDYSTGGFVHTERIERVTRETPRVLLDCGHYRRQSPGVKSITEAKRLACWECERLELQPNTDYPER